MKAVFVLACAALLAVASAVPTPKVAVKPAVKPLVKPAAKPLVKPAAKPLVKPTVKPAVAGCPSPLALCDLSFGRPIVPKFNVLANKGNRILTTATVYTKDGKPVQTLSTYGCRFYGGGGGNCGGFGFFPPDLTTNITNTLGTYPMLANQAQALANKCIVLTVDNFYVAGMGWVNHGDNNKKFPAIRRCLIIKT